MPNHRRTRYRPHGATLLECVVALGILGAAMTLGAQALGWSSAQRRLADQRHLALQEAVNCLERVRMIPWQDLSEARLAEIELSAEARRRLSAATLKIESQSASSGPTAKRIHVKIAWQSQGGNLPLQVNLVTWRYQTRPAE